MYEYSTGLGAALHSKLHVAAHNYRALCLPAQFRDAPSDWPAAAAAANERAARDDDVRLKRRTL